MNNIKIDIRENYNRASLEIWVFEYDHKSQWNLSTEDGQLVRTEIPELFSLIDENKVKPFLTLPRRLGAEVLKAITEWHSENGVKTVNQNYIEGKLEATEKHLADMCRITAKLLKL